MEGLGHKHLLTLKQNISNNKVRAKAILNLVLDLPFSAPSFIGSNLFSSSKRNRIHTLSFFIQDAKEEEEEGVFQYGTGHQSLFKD